MDNEKKILKFDLSNKGLKIRDLLEGDFLELEAYTISDANPNRNGSHFTLEAMQEAIPTFYNKPVLGAFNREIGPEGDFMGHECPNGLEYDRELESLYYDYSAPGSEIPVGIIRESDNVEIVKDPKTGLSWIKLTCSLWCKYNFKAIKALLKSRKGKSKISVEVEVLKSHMVDGIEYIDAFQLDGFTILGRDERGREISEGIEGAHLSVIDLVEDAVFANKRKALAFAYDALDKASQKAESPEDNRDSYTTDNEVEFEGVLGNEHKDEIVMDDQVEK